MTSYTEKQNNYVSSLNNLIFNLTCRHSDVNFFDTNLFVSPVQDLLSPRSKDGLASLLAYNIESSHVYTQPIGTINTSDNTVYTDKEVAHKGSSNSFNSTSNNKLVCDSRMSLNH